MKLTETARTRRSHNQLDPILSMPFPFGATIQTEPTKAPAPQEYLSFFSAQLVQEGLIPEAAIFEDEVGTSARFAANSPLNWITAPEPALAQAPIDRLSEAIIAFGDLPEVSAIAVDDTPGEKTAFIFLRAAQRSDELLLKLIKVEELVQDHLPDLFISFNYIPLAGRRPETVAPSTAYWVKK